MKLSNKPLPCPDRRSSVLGRLDKMMNSKIIFLGDGLVGGAVLAGENAPVLSARSFEIGGIAFRSKIHNPYSSTARSAIMIPYETDIFPEKNRTFADTVLDERPPQKMSIAREQIFSSVGAALAPWYHIALVSHAEIHRTIADALAAMPDDPNLSWVTGSSKTGNVEGIPIQGV
jgi:hypothetical protein